MPDGSRRRSPRADHPRSTMPSIDTAKAPHAKSSPHSPARLATCLRLGRMSRLPLVTCFCCSGCWSICVTVPIGAMRTPPGGAGGRDRLRAMGGRQHRDNRRNRRRRRRSASLPADIAGRTEKADLVGPDQGRDCGCLERRTGIAPPDRDEPRRRRDGYPYACRIPFLSRSHCGARTGAQYRKTGGAAVRPAARSPNRSAVPIGNPPAWPLVKRSPG